MANKYEKWCIIVKPAIETHTPEQLTLRKVTILSFDGDMKQLKSSFIADRSVDVCNHFRKLFASIANFLLLVIYQRGMNEGRYPPKDLYKDVQRRLIHNN